MESQVRQNYHRDCEAAINRMANMELYASYVYLSMGFYFDRDDVALSRLSRYFLQQSREEREHAEGLLRFQTNRGGRILLQDIKKPERDTWGSALEAVEAALQLEKSVNQALLELHALAGRAGEGHQGSGRPRNQPAPPQQQRGGPERPGRVPVRPPEPWPRGTPRAARRVLGIGSCGLREIVLCSFGGRIAVSVCCPFAPRSCYKKESAVIFLKSFLL